MALAGLAAPLRAQFFAFGQNKVQYRTFDWRILKGPHVDLYFYPAEATLAPAALAYAEESYDSLALKFGHQVRTRVPIIIYASHIDFEQSNLLPFVPPEGLLGSTDFLKRRVALPFRGNMADFRHTLRHELVHVFQMSLETDSYYEVYHGTRVHFPLWWTEGLAEYWSAGEDARDNMLLRDLTLSGRLPRLQDMTYLTSAVIYPLGGRIHRWLGQAYGDWRVALMYHEIARHASFEEAIQSVYGKSLAQLNDEFQFAMRQAYYPVIADYKPLPVLARKLATLAVKPAWVPDTTGRTSGSVVYISAADGYISIFRAPLDGGSPEKLLTTGRSSALESVHPFDSRLDASRPGYLLLTSKEGERDALLIWDIKKRRIVGRYTFPRLVSILSPAWLPDASGIVFSGLAESGVSDLYLLHLADGALEPLTSDRYQDSDPSPSPDGSRVVFASDRRAGGLTGGANLFILDLATRAIRPLTSGDWTDETPTWADSDRVWFTSDRDGVLNVFSTDTLGNGRRETSAWTGAFDAAPLPGGHGVLVGGFHDLSWNVYLYPTDSAAHADRFALDSAPPAGRWTWDTTGTTAAVDAGSQPYHRSYALDFAVGDAAFIPGIGGAQGVAFLMSDMLEDNLIYGSVSSYQGRDLGSVFENVNATAIYLNQAHRVNWGVGAFRDRGNGYEGGLMPDYFESAFGGVGLLRYPLSAFSRIEATIVVEHSDRTDFTLPVRDPRRVGWIASQYLSYVHDNALWIPAGPIDGSRFSVTAGISSDFTNSRFDSFLLTADWRHYFRLGSQSAYAVRATGFYSGGDRPQRTNIGGTTGLRGYPLYGYIVGSRSYLLNQELRFPMLTHLTFGTPMGDLRFPGIQGALFIDLGRAWFSRDDGRALLGSYGLSFRMPLDVLAVLRLDVGRRFGSHRLTGYNLDAGQRSAGFVSFFFGYDY